MKPKYLVPYNGTMKCILWISERIRLRPSPNSATPTIYLLSTEFIGDETFSTCANVMVSGGKSNLNISTAHRTMTGKK